MECVDLRQFGDTYRVAAEESYRAETGSTIERCTDPWLFILRGSQGHVCPWGGELLALCVDDGHPKLCGRLARESSVMLDRSQIGDDGGNFVFHVRDLPKAAKYAKLYRRRQLTDEQKAERTARLRRRPPVTARSEGQNRTQAV